MSISLLLQESEVKQWTAKGSWEYPTYMMNNKLTDDKIIRTNLLSSCNLKRFLYNYILLQITATQIVVHHSIMYEYFQDLVIKYHSVVGLSLMCRHKFKNYRWLILQSKFWKLQDTHKHNFRIIGYSKA